MSISFSQIPIDTRTPGHYLEVDASRAMQGLPIQRHRILLVGQASGSEMLGKLARIDSVDQCERVMGRGSLMTSMYRAARAVNRSTEIWCLAVQNSGAATATGTITFSGTPTLTKAMEWHIGGRPVSISVSKDEAPSSVATKLRNAIAADDRMLVNASVAGAVVTLTAKFSGYLGNAIGITYGLNALSDSGAVPGLGVAVVYMNGGTLAPSLTSFETVVGSEWFQTIVLPYNDLTSVQTVEASMAARFGPMVQLDGHVFIGLNGSLAQASQAGNASNSPHLTLVYSGKSQTPMWEWAAQVAALDAGEPDPARPRQTLKLTVLAPAVSDRPMQEERNVLLHDGVSTSTVDASGTVRIERLITTYKTNEWGATDTAFLDIETMRTLSYLRFSLRNRIGTKYPRHKLASDGTLYGPGQAIVTPSVIRSELLALFREWEYAGLVEGFDQFKADLIVERNSQDPNRVDAVIPPDVVNQFRVFAGLVQFRL